VRRSIVAESIRFTPLDPQSSTDGPLGSARRPDVVGPAEPTDVTGVDRETCRDQATLAVVRSAAEIDSPVRGVWAAWCSRITAEIRFSTRIFLVEVMDRAERVGRSAGRAELGHPGLGAGRRAGPQHVRVFDLIDARRGPGFTADHPQ